MGEEKQRKILSYSDFIRRVLPVDGSPSSAYKVVLTNGEDIARVEDKSGEIYFARVPANLLGANPELADKLVERGVQVDVQAKPSENVWAGVLSNFLVPLVLFGLFLFMLRNVGGGGAMSFGKSRARLMTKDINITFDDVAGIEESKKELEEIVDFLKNSQKYTSLGAKIPKGVMLLGPPGCGKTLLAKAVAGEAGVPFFSISGSDFVEMFVGVGASRVRDLFEQAKKNAPCIVFIDEIDAVGRQRSGMSGGGNDEREQTLNQLLVEMDGFQPNSGIIVLAATNRPDVLDKALLRPGRFDRKVTIDTPDYNGRLEILKVHTRGKPISQDVDLETLARRTPGFSGADIANLINESAILAARESKKEIEMHFLEDAIDKVAIGPERKSKIIKPKDQVNTAIHEVGHTLISIFYESSNEFHKVTIIPRGMALGLTWSTEEEYRVSQSEKQLRVEMRVLLGGRAAEEIIFGRENVTTGASNDMERCSAIARAMITRFGMNDSLGIVTYGDRQGNSFLDQEFSSRNYSEGYANKIDAEVQNLIDLLYKEVKQCLNDHRNELLAVSQVLLQKETLDKEEVFQVLEQVKTGEFETLPLDQFETLASSRTPEKIKLLIKEEQDKRRAERERLRHLEQLKKSAEQNEQERPRDERFYG
ncbi:ATP-dependent zinc metalloprotease FtsH [Planctomyces bekefii]|uniref:ATP-dependent zinc metalloprotease FtsH n=1 Tax=Planctomyces bekefii TaxID=1653850 RepID=A0A5C6M4D4_9PLAN|nr:ATP-dependent zinc metalloprotease FtsH [Planctomyces bekefii]